MRLDHDEQFRISKLFLPCAVFLLLLLVPLYWVFVRQDRFMPLEKKYRQQLPPFTAQNLLYGSWTGEVEGFLSDRFPLRNELLALYNYSAKLFGMQNGRSVFITQTGALVEAPCERSDQGLQIRLRTIQDFADHIDQPVSLFIVPTAGYCAGAQLNRLAADCYFDDQVSDLAEQSAAGNLRFIPALPAFAQETQPLFYSTDHHWNAQGAYLAYRLICEGLSIEPAQAQHFQRSWYDGFYGTTYSRSGLWGKPSDRLEIWNDYTPVTVRFSDGDRLYDSMFFEDHLLPSVLDKYPVFLDGNHPLTVIDNLQDDRGKVLLVVKDSYANSVVPLLIHHYDKIVLVDLRYYKQAITTVLAEQDVTDVLVLYSTENMIHSTDLLFLWLNAD